MKLKRYNCCDHTQGAAMHESTEGGFVKFSDHEAALAEAVMEEREACALICDSVNSFSNPMTATDCADAIRARGNTTSEGTANDQNFD